MLSLQLPAVDNSKVSKHFIYKSLGIEDSIKFLEETKDRLKNKSDALFLIDIAQADKKLALGQHHDCIERLNNIKMRIE